MTASIAERLADLERRASSEYANQVRCKARKICVAAGVAIPAWARVRPHGPPPKKIATKPKRDGASRFHQSDAAEIAAMRARLLADEEAAWTAAAARDRA